MAEIFHAERVGAMNISREVCVKCIRPALCTDQDFVTMFIDEARISATLRHSNIVSIDHFGKHDGALFSVMEWVHGTDAARLHKRLSNEGRRMPVDVALFIVGEVLKALEYAHGKTENGQWLRIVHRDVTPHNVMISFSGEVKLTDFGIAKATSRLHHTQGSIVKGKVAYMAPEQAMGLALDNRTDLFAVGVMAFELLAGRRPFVGATQVDGVHAMLRGERPTLRSLRPEAGVDAEAVVDRLLAVKPDDRYPDAGAALDALQVVPMFASGQRSLQRLLRELFADVQHSTVLPRFAGPTDAPSQPSQPSMRSAPVPPATPLPAATSPVDAFQPTDTAPTAPRPAPRHTEPLPAADRTLTSNRAPDPQVARTEPAQRPAMVGSAPVVAVEPARAPSGSRWPFALLGVSLLVASGVAALWITQTAPAANAPAANVPAANVPIANVPSANAPAANVPVANVPVANVPAANVPARAVADAAVVATVDASVDAAAQPAAVAEARLATIEVRASPHTLLEFRLDSRNAPSMPLHATFRVAPGRHTLYVDRDGVPFETVHINVEPGERWTRRWSRLPD